MSGDVVPSAPRSSAARPGDLQGRLEALGLPGHLLGDTFADDVARQGTYAALTQALGRRLPAPPALPSGAGEVLFVVGPGVETLRAAAASPRRCGWTATASSGPRGASSPAWRPRAAA